MIIDAHSHIQLKKEFPDVEEVIERAENAGVGVQLIIGYNMGTNRKAVEFVRAHVSEGREGSKFWSAVGIHPHDADEVNDENLKLLEKMVVSEEKVIAIGEIGLDYFRNFQSADLQKDAFRRQLQLAKKLDVPVVLHVREAMSDTLEILAEEGNTKVIMHSYSGNMEDAMVCFDRGYFLSFSGPLTYPKNELLRQIATLVPRDKFLTETDCPYLPPQKYRGQRNEPAYVKEVAEEFARVNKMSMEDVENQIVLNFESCFGVKLA